MQPCSSHYPSATSAAHTLHRALFLALSIALILIAGSSQSEAKQRSEKPGFFQVKKMGELWWMLDPDQKPFISKGVAAVNYEGAKIRNTSVAPYEVANEHKYGGVEEWRKATAKRLQEWGFNTLGSWSDIAISTEAQEKSKLAYTVNLDLGAVFTDRASNGWEAWIKGVFPDVFDPAFAAFCRGVAQERCAPLRNDRNLIGYYLDNELHWGPDWRHPDELLISFLNKVEETPGHAAAVKFLQERYRSTEALNTVWKTQFRNWQEVASNKRWEAPFRRATLREPEEPSSLANAQNYFEACQAFKQQAAERYFQITDAAIQAADPNHLNLGPRFTAAPGNDVLQTAAKYIDVLSLTAYDIGPTRAIAHYSVLDLPIIITEFSFRARDSGLPNTKGAGPLLNTQSDRANAFEKYVQVALSNPQVVGYHWFRWVDQPREGRADGENSNFGIVNIKDDPYSTLVDKMRTVNAQAESLHQSATEPVN